MVFPKYGFHRSHFDRLLIFLRKQLNGFKLYNATKLAEVGECNRNVGSSTREWSLFSAGRELHTAGPLSREWRGPARPPTSVACTTTLGDLWRVLTLFLFQPGAERLPSQELTHLLLQEVRYE